MANVTTTGDSDLQRAVAVVQHCLGATLPQKVTPLAASSSSAIASTVTKHRLSRLVVNADIPLGLEPPDLEKVTNDALAHTHAAFQLVARTTQVTGLLDENGVDFLVIKGVALGALSQTPAGRGAGDVDILVHPTDVPRVHGIFRDNGFRPALAQPDVSHPLTWRVWSFVDREATYLGHNTHIDLHWRISSQRQLFPPFSDLFARRVMVTVADTTLPTLGVADSLAAACYHSYFDQFQPFRSMVDVASLLKVTGGITLPDYSPKLKRLISGVLHLTKELFPGVVDAEIDHITSTLPPPHPIVRHRFNEALTTPKTVWEVSHDTGAVLRKMRAEAPFDHAIDVIPRFIGKRLLHFPHWSETTQTTTLGQALTHRIQVEARRRKRR